MKEPSVPNPQEARLEASVEMGTLCAFYGGLLTDKQLQAMQLHFDEDLSLGEIARQMNVSRQNVHDLIARSSEKLRACEAALGAAGRMERMLERLARVQELLGDVKADESRLLTEVTVYADKICVDEEIVRLQSHISAMKKSLTDGGSIGRKLDFLAQEMNREANTILSKTTDLELSNCGIELKTLIEKVREQIQNIE